MKDTLIIATKEICSVETDLFKSISLSRDTATRRIEEMENDVTNQLKEKIKSFLYFSLALDESTDTAQLLIYIRGVDMELNIIEELLDIVSLKGRTCGEDIFDAVHDVGLKFALNWDKLVSITTDGAPSMTGREKGFVSRLRKFLSINNLPESKTS